MARGVFRKVSFMKTVGAYRSMWKRMLLRMFFPGYGKKGMGWLINPKKAWYNWIYYRTSISIPRLLGYKPSFGATMAALFVASVFNVAALPVDTVKAAAKSKRIKKNVNERKRSFGKSSDSRRKSTTQLTKEGKSNTRNVTKSTLKKASTPKTATTNLQKASSTLRRDSSTVPKTNNDIHTDTDNHNNPPVRECDDNVTIIDDDISETTTKKDINPIQLQTTVPDENVPKSVPKSEKDSYIRKRIILDNTINNIGNVIDIITQGMYLDVENDVVSNRVKLIYEDKIIGYISVEDSFPVILCLRLGRKIYGIITDIKSVDGNFVIEVELWFSEGN